MTDLTLAATCAISILVSYFVIVSNSNIHKGLLSYAGFSIVSIAWAFARARITARGADRLAADYRREKFRQYERMDQTSRNSSDIGAFSDLVDSGMGAVRSNYSLLVDTVGATAVTVYGTGVVLFREGNYAAFAACILVNVIVYFGLSRRLAKRRKALVDSRRRERREYLGRRKLTLARFHSREYSAELVADFLAAEQARGREFENALSLAGLVGLIAGRVALAAMFLAEVAGGAAPSYAANVGIYIVFERLYGIVNRLVDSKAEHSDNAASLQEVEEFFAKKTSLAGPEQIPMPPAAAVGGDVRYLGRVGPLAIGWGSRVVIRGPSGVGKTTLMDAMLGVDSTGTPNALAYRRAGRGGARGRPIAPLRFRDDAVFLNQVSVNNTDLVASTLDTLFTIDQLRPEEQDAARALARECLASVRLDQWLESRLAGSFSDPVAGRCSAGEATRICLATTLHRMFSRNRRLLFLDEADRGLDPEVAADLMTTVLTHPRLQDKTVVAISHVCDCVLASIRGKSDRPLTIWEVTPAGVRARTF